MSLMRASANERPRGGLGGEETEVLQRPNDVANGVGGSAGVTGESAVRLRGRTRTCGEAGGGASRCLLDHRGSVEEAELLRRCGTKLGARGGVGNQVVRAERDVLGEGHDARAVGEGDRGSTVRSLDGGRSDIAAEREVDTRVRGTDEAVERNNRPGKCGSGHEP